MSSLPKPRLSIEITEAQSLALQKILDYGIKKAVFSTIIDDLINLFNTHGHHGIIGILDGTVVLTTTGDFKYATTKPSSILARNALRKAAAVDAGNSNEPESE